MGVQRRSPQLPALHPHREAIPYVPEAPPFFDHVQSELRLVRILKEIQRADADLRAGIGQTDCNDDGYGHLQSGSGKCTHCTAHQMVPPQ